MMALNGFWSPVRRWHFYQRDNGLALCGRFFSYDDRKGSASRDPNHPHNCKFCRERYLLGRPRSITRIKGNVTVERLTMKTIEESIEELCHSFASGVNSLATGDFVREGIIREAVTSLVWELYRQMPDQRDALATALEDFDDHVRNAVLEDAAKAQSAD